ncbi:CrcB family protein [Nocardioides mangrovicus]|uniref:Fluoride-specific ion channel FluC n=1 Tax=Nocardioides mangrovicus TaxID=2478913 RepID=A0A3L8P7Q0_9ACTN|nr:CrcB family protein [Nocardioides mangrovicus]RLV50972.1 CrcB family protein [Nocardioides mangrovicus]
MSPDDRPDESPDHLDRPGRTGSEPEDTDRDRPRPPRLEWDVVGVVAAGGAIGSVARWGVGELVPHAAGAFVWSTFLDNVPGAFLLGLLTALVYDVWAPTRLVRPFWGVGVLGGYTTFSTWMLDAHDQLRAGALPTLALYVSLTLVLGLAAAWAGLALGRRFA